MVCGCVFWWVGRYISGETCVRLQGIRTVVGEGQDLMGYQFLLLSGVGPKYRFSPRCPFHYIEDVGSRVL